MPVDVERLRADVAWLARSPRASPTRREAVRSWLEERSTDLGFTVERRPFTLSGVEGVNVVALGAPGTVWVGAHYDTVSETEGADDDASGVAALLEVARLLGPAAPVRYVLFDAEEPHGAPVGADGRNFAYGSQAFVDAGTDASAVFVLESVGYTCTTPRCQQLPAGIPDGLVKVDGTAVAWVADTPSGAPWRDWIATARAAVPARPLVALGIPDHGAGLAQARFSDHAPFWDAGIPAVMVTDTALLRNPHYHRPGDTLDTLDLSFLSDNVRAVVAALRHATGTCPPG